MKQQEIDAIEAELNATTPGDWRHEGIPYRDMDGDPVILAGDVYIAQTVYDMQSMTQEHHVDADTIFLANSKRHVRQLLDDNERLRALVKAAFEEGASDVQGQYTTEERWATSNTRKALEAHP